VEEEAMAGYLTGGELWLFIDNMTAEGCFFRGGSSSKQLHELVLWLTRKTKLEYDLTLHVVHVAGTRMIAQGKDGLSRGIFLEGVVRGEDMLSFVDLSSTAIEQHPGVLEFVRSRVGPILGGSTVLLPEEWFREGHGIVGGTKDSTGLWIPQHVIDGKVYIWSPPPIIADVALEECAKAIHKRTDAYHIFLIPRLYSPLWMQLLYKVSDFVFQLPPRLTHEPLFIGISFPLLHKNPWSIRRTLLLVELERQLRQVLRAGEEDGGNILRKLLQTSRQLASVSESVACQMLRMSRPGEVSNQEDSG
jgi:hypothetical protein